MHGAEVKGVDCPAIDGIIEEANEVAGEVADGNVLDAALIHAAQKIFRAAISHALPVQTATLRPKTKHIRATQAPVSR